MQHLGAHRDSLFPDRVTEIAATLFVVFFSCDKLKDGSKQQQT